MSLTIVSTPIGNLGDVTLRAIQTLNASDAIICEELKPARVLLKRLDISERPLYQLNEHTKDIKELIDLCRTQNVALISDCGTPGFCDPGSALVDACYAQRIKVDVNPGPSSLTAFLALCGFNLKEFYFVGFLPAERNERLKKIKSLKNITTPLVVMDTPYRLAATIKDLSEEFPERQAVVGLDLTGGGQKIIRGKLGQLAKQDWAKIPFVLMII